MQAGFSLQADLLTSGSLLHTTTGRLLKAYSDGGVDFYAIAAAIQLGKQIPIQAAHEAEVSRILNKRTGRAGYLAKALSIGWGHSDIAIELSRTRAGTSALLTIGALATGSTIYTATQAFSELLNLSGCPPEEMPNFDVLKTMINYLAPFMSDLGFRKVFQHVITASKQRCSEAGAHCAPRLEATGEAVEWAKAVRQLVLTAQRLESVHLQTSQRGAWLAVYASHILGMAVQVSMDGLVLWQAAGTAGAVWIQLAEVTAKQQILLSGDEDLHIVNPPTTQDGERPMTYDYAIGEALAAEISLDARVTRSIADSVERAIVRLSATVKRQVRIQYVEDSSETGHKINGYFGDSRKTIQGECTTLGISSQNFEIGFATASRRIKTWTRNQKAKSTRSVGLEYLDETEAHELRSMCGAHRANHEDLIKTSNTSICLCCRIGTLILGFSAAALALMQCVYDATGLRVQADVVNGTRMTKWAKYAFQCKGVCDGSIDCIEVVNYLCQLLHGYEVPETLSTDHAIWRFRGILAVSIGSVTVYYRALLDKECFDQKGRMLAIASGRISCNGELRPLVTEPIYFTSDEKHGAVGIFAKMADQSVITPHYISGPLKIKGQISLAEEGTFLVKCGLGDNEGGFSTSIALRWCIQNILRIRVMEDCSHDKNRGYVVRDSRGFTYVASVWKKNFRDTPADDSVVLYALKDSTLEQLLLIGLRSRLGSTFSDVENVVLQGDSCLECAVNFLQESAEKKGEVVHVIMT
ncbi:uncharacterized protein PAC_18701 [Phialocephala subalpina]|uniref:Uncharacterized protein n=1 Tax=Phialocephala subalpina TaxID=576137 RepID=A0A1L7XUV6_9HELO|nr:uncharacterized protein PAC_18701 [Phialocephala subalpina]